MKVITIILAFNNINVCAGAQQFYIIPSNPFIRNATSMLFSTFGWQFHFNAFFGTRSHTKNHHSVGLTEASRKQTNLWPMKKI
jgi:hypothetical protein